MTNGVGAEEKFEGRERSRWSGFARDLLNIIPTTIPFLASATFARLG